MKKQTCRLLSLVLCSIMVFCSFAIVGAETADEELTLNLETAQYLPDTNQVFVEAELNENLKNKNGTLIFALYDNSGRFIECSPKVSLEAPEYTFDGLSDYEESYTVKALYLENLTSLKALYESAPSATVDQNETVEPDPVTTILRQNTFDEYDYPDWFTSNKDFTILQLRNFYYGVPSQETLDGSKAAKLTREGSSTVNIGVSPVAPAELYTQYSENDLVDCGKPLVFQEDFMIPEAGTLEFKMRKAVDYTTNLMLLRLNKDYSIDVNGGSSDTEMQTLAEKTWKTNTTYTITLYYGPNEGADNTFNLYLGEKGKAPELLLFTTIPRTGINPGKTFSHFFTTYTIQDASKKPVLYLDNIYVYTQAGIALKNADEVKTFKSSDGIQVDFTNLVDANSLSGIKVSEKETGNEINATATINANMRSISVKSDDFEVGKKYIVSFEGVKGIFGTNVLKSTHVITANCTN